MQIPELESLDKFSVFRSYVCRFFHDLGNPLSRFFNLARRVVEGGKFKAPVYWIRQLPLGSGLFQRGFLHQVDVIPRPVLQRPGLRFLCQFSSFEALLS